VSLLLRGELQQSIRVVDGEVKLPVATEIGDFDQYDVPSLVETNAGIGSGYTDDAYRSAGAQIVESKKRLWNESSVIKKVKEPIAEEYGFLDAKHIIFSFLHLASPASKPLVKELLLKKVTAIAYETIVLEGDAILLKPMSEVAGTLAAYYGGIIKNNLEVGDKKLGNIDTATRLMQDLASRYPAIPTKLNPGNVCVLGGGHAGLEAATVAESMGGSVWISEIAEVRKTLIEKEIRTRKLRMRLTSPKNPEYTDILKRADVIIGAVHAAGRRAPCVIDDQLLHEISAAKKKIILDIAIDQGGNIFGSIPKSYRDPLYLDRECNIRFSVANMPALCGAGATRALEDASIDYTLALSAGVQSAIEEYPELQSGASTWLA